MYLVHFFEDPVSYVSGWQGGWDQIALTRYVWQWSKRYNTLKSGQLRVNLQLYVDISK